MSFTGENLAGRPDLIRRAYEYAGASFSGATSGAEHRTLCPFHPDRSPSLDVNFEKGFFICRSCGKSGDAVDFVSLQQRASTDEAIVLLRRYLGISDPARKAAPAQGGPTPPPGSPPRSSTSWEIRNAAGELVAVHERAELPGGKKTFGWRRNGKSGLGGLPVSELPLYRSEHLKDSRDAAIVCEGEKSADALAAHGFLSLGTVTGASSVPGLSALEVLRGRDVFLWPDHDRPGRDHMAKIAATLGGVASAVRFVEWGDREKDDAADFFARGGTAEQLESLLADAPNALQRQTETPSPLISESLLDWQNSPPPPVRWVVEGLIPEGSVCLLFGRPFGGKSLFALQLSLYLAAGLEFLPRVVPDDSRSSFGCPKPRGVLYVDEEMGRPLMFARTQRMKAGREEFRGREVLERIRVTSRKGLKLDRKDSLDLLRREIGDFPGGPPGVVFLDTLRRAHDKKESSADEMSGVMEAAVRICEDYGCSIVPIHHSTKAPSEEGDWRDAARGSGDLVAASQSIISIWKVGDGLFSMRADAKASGELEPLALALDPLTLLYRVQGEEERFATKEAQKEGAIRMLGPALLKSLRLLKTDPGALTKRFRLANEKIPESPYPPSGTVWKKATEGNDATLTVAIARLAEASDVRKLRRLGRGGGPAYCFVEDADELIADGGYSDASELEVGP